MVVPIIIAALVVALALAAYVRLRVDRWRRTPAELRGDWWTGFETEFRAYVSRMEQSRRPGKQRRNDHGSIGQ